MSDFIVPGTNGMQRFWRLNASGADEIGGNTLSVSNTTYKKTPRGYQTYCATANGSNSSMTSWTTVSGVRTLFFSIFPTANNRTFLTATGITVTVNSSSQIATSGLTGVSVTVNGQPTSSIALNAWNFVTLTHDSANYASVNIFASSFIGDAQEVGTFDRVISETEIRNWYLESLRALWGSTLAGLMDGCVAYYDMRGDANDIVGGYDGTVSWATLVADRFGTADSAYSFNGSSDYITTTVSTFSTSNWYSLCAWIKCTSLNTEANIISKDNNVWLWTRDWQFRANSNWTLNFFRSNSWGVLSDINTAWYTVNDWNWRFVVATFDTTNWSNVYIDWVSRASSGVLTMNSISNTAIQIWARWDNQWKFTGQISSPLVLNKGLSATEVKALYELSSKSKLLPFA